MIDWFYPGYKAGGPVRSCYNLVQQLNTEFSFKIITTNSDYQETIPYENIISDRWIKLNENIDIYYCSSDGTGLKNLYSLIKQTSFDILYLNSLYSIKFSIFPLLAVNSMRKKIKIVLAPRGMLAKGSLSLKPYKKNLFLSLGKALGLFENINWQATVEYEANDIINVFGKNNKIFIAENLTDPELKNIQFIPKIKEPFHAKFFYLSRISPVKNLKYALLQLKKIPIKYTITYDIFGQIDDTSYWNECNEIITSIAQKNPNISIDYKGTVDHSNIHNTLQDYHFHFLPTKNENYGHSIVESFFAGCPVIISNQTPWKNLKENKIGWDISLNNEQAIYDAIIQAASFDEKTYNVWSNNAYEYAKKIILDDKPIQQHIELFNNAQ